MRGFKLPLLFGFILIGLFYQGCFHDKSSVTEFLVENRLVSSVKVDVKMSLYFEDTSYLIQSDSSIRVDLRGDAGQVQDYVIDGLFPHISVQLVESEETLDKDFSKREEWEYNEVDDFYAIYTLVIDESDL